MEIYGISLNDFHWLNLLQSSLFRDLVLSRIGIVFQMTGIGYISHIPYFIAQMLQISKNHIKRHKSPAISQVNIAVNRWTTNIHAYMALVYRFKDFFFTGKGIVNL